MKRLTKRAAAAALVLLLILLAALPAAAEGPSESAAQDLAQPVEEEATSRYMKIGLFYGTSARASVSLRSSSGLLLCAPAEDGSVTPEALAAAAPAADTATDAGIETPAEPENPRDLGSGTSFTVEAAGSKAVLKDASGTVLCEDLTGLYLFPKDAPETRKLGINEREYRGGVTFLAEGGLLTVINYVELEHYLWGVLNPEMGAHYPLEALKAQAVAARSFALCNTKHSRLGFDMCSTSDCQVYQGAAAERERSTQACLETAGLVMTYEDRIVPGYYMAYSGGYILNCEDVWGNYSGYLRGRRDEFTPEYNWQTQFTFAEIRDRLVQRGYDDPGNIRSVRIDGRSAQGAVLAIVVEGDSRTVRFSRENVRTVLSLRSSQFSIGPSAYPGIEHTDGGAPRLYTAEGIVEAPETVGVLAADGELTPLSLIGLTVLSAEGASEVAAGGPGEILFTDETVTSGEIFLNGLGWGHGLGLSQAGARVMAESGYRFDEILHYYYTGIELQHLHERQ